MGFGVARLARGAGPGGRRKMVQILISSIINLAGVGKG